MTVLAAEVAEGAGEGAATGARGAARARARQAARQYSSQASYVGSNAQVAPGGRGYQPVLLAEFLAAVVIVALVPVAAGGSANAKAKDSPSPYDTNDLVQLVAVGGLYFILALASSGNSGRVSAWFGGLVLIGLTIVKLSHGQLGAVFTALSGGPKDNSAGLCPVRGLARVRRVGR